MALEDATEKTVSSFLVMIPALFNSQEKGTGRIQE